MKHILILYVVALCSLGGCKSKSAEKEESVREVNLPSRPAALSIDVDARLSERAERQIQFEDVDLEIQKLEREVSGLERKGLRKPRGTTGTSR